MYYDRPRKRKKPEEVLKREEAAREKRIEEKRREEKFSLGRFFFETPVHEPKGYQEEEDREDREDIGENEPGEKKKHFLSKACALFLAGVFVLSLLLYFLPVGLFGSRSKDMYLANNDLPSGYVHVLLVGVDVDSTGTSRSDTMIVASVSKGDIKLTSLLRDTGVTIPGRSGKHRLNAAYAYGGIDLLLKTVNQNFGLNITRYAIVDYDSFPKIIDKLGGVTLTVSDAEANEINDNVRGLLYMDVKNGKREYDAGYQLYLDEILEKGGENLRLDGLQTLGYARIRSLDSDYGRTNRQRKVLSAILSQVKKHPLKLIGAAGTALGEIDTNMNTLEIASIALKGIAGGVPEQTRLPASGTYTDNGGMFENVDFKANLSRFLDFVYE
ncbi:MAG: LCP family protein [Clostridia bacterium]|nr:LCP family protein [Clostridia bacterium]